MKTTSPLLAGFALAIVVAACTGSGGASPSPSPTLPPPTAQPSPTPPPSDDAPVVGSPEEAAARVIASDPRFTGILRKDSNMIGQGSWWEAGLSDDSFRVQVQIGWGDCPAGCINRHDWFFDVGADGSITLVEETGDPLEGATG